MDFILFYGITMRLLHVRAPIKVVVFLNMFSLELRPSIGSIDGLWKCHHTISSAQILIEIIVVGATLCGFYNFYGITMQLLHVNAPNN